MKYNKESAQMSRPAAWVAGWLVVLVGALPVAAAAETAPLAGAGAVGNWRFGNGPEFKGATGALAQSGEGIALHYDFTAGGAYVEALWGGAALPAELSAIRLTVSADSESELKFRVIAGERCFQGAAQHLAKGKPTVVTISIAGPWPQVWGGEKIPAPTGPLSKFAVLATKHGSPSGTVTISDVQLVTH